MVTATALVSRSWRKNSNGVKPLQQPDMFVSFNWEQAQNLPALQLTLSSGSEYLVLIQRQSEAIFQKTGLPNSIHHSKNQIKENLGQCKAQRTSPVESRNSPKSNYSTTAYACMQSVWPVGSQGWKVDQKLYLTNKKKIHPKSFFLSRCPGHWYTVLLHYTVEIKSSHRALHPCLVQSIQINKH